MSTVINTERRQKRLEEILSTIFSSTARTTVLKAMLIDPTRAYYQRQIESATGLALRAVQRELERLSRAKLLYRRQEGNRAYYQADAESVFFPELRAMILKASSPAERLRAVLATDPAVRLAFLDAACARALVVGHGASRPTPPPASGFALELMSSEQFAALLHENATALDPFLRDGADLLGRRDDVVWRRIEEAGYTVARGDGVP